MMLTRRSALMGVPLVVCLLAGCSARKPAGFSNRFVHAGEPEIHYGSPPAPRSLEGYIAKVRTIAANARPAPKGDLLPRIEGRDPELAAALLEVGALPSVEAHVRAAAAYRRLGISDAAFEHLNRALKLDSRSAVAYEARARTWRDSGFPERGLADAHRAVHHAPRSPAALNTLGTLLQALGQRGQARRVYARAVRLDPSAAYALNNLCYVSFLNAKLDEAIRQCTAALAADPSLAAARNNLALAHAATGRMDLARQEFAAAGREAAAHYNTGIVHLAEGQYQQAAEAFEAASSSDPALTAAGVRARQARGLARQAPPGGQ